MGFFKKTKDPQKELAKAVAKNGASVRGTIEAMAPTGATSHDGVGVEHEFTLAFELNGAPQRVTVRQWMNEATLTGLAAGEPVDLMVDRTNPQNAVVFGSPKYKIVGGDGGGWAVVRSAETDAGAD